MHHDTRVAALILLAAVSVNLAVLQAEVAVDTPPLNDSTLHLALVARTVDALERGEDPTDPWVPYFVEGYPLFHYYQHLPHIATALLFKALGGAVPLRTLFNALRWLLLATFPLSVYWTGRRLGCGALPSALAGLISALLSTNGLYGVDWASYLWRGYGMYTQLWGMWLVGPALAGLYVTLRDGRACAGTAALLAVTLLSHTVLGYAALLSGVLFLLTGGSTVFLRRARRLALTGLLVAAAASYFLVPFLLDRAYMNRSVWEDPGKYDAYGWEWTLGALARGELLDASRFPALTALAALGLIICLLNWRRNERYRLLPSFTTFWLLLYFGRPTWGALLDLLPLGGDLHFHRLIVPVHLGAVGLAGAGLGGLASRILGVRPGLWTDRGWPGGRARPIRLAAAIAAGFAVAGLLVPIYAERLSYAATNARWLRENAAAFQADGGQSDALLADLMARPRARVYAGRGATWGKDYRIGSVPVYAVLAANQVENPGYLYHALSLNADVEGYLDETRPATFNLFNLRYVVAPEGQRAPAGARRIAVYGNHHLYEMATTGYFDLVDSDMLFYGERPGWFAAAHAWLQSGMVEARQHPEIIFGPAPAGSGRPALSFNAVAAELASGVWPEHAPCGRLEGEQLAGNRYAVTFTSMRECWLLFKATFHPGWEAVLDGQPVPIRMLAPSFVGLAVGPGRHQAVLTYRPGRLRLPLLAAGVGTLLLATAAERQRSRRHPQMSRLFGAPATPLAAFSKRLAALPRRFAAGHSQLAILALIILLAALPTLQLKQMSGHDALEYLPRTVEFYQGLAEGQILPRWAPDLSHGYGQPFFIFNPPLIYYLASALHTLGTSFLAALNLACLALLAVAGLGMYCFAHEFFGAEGALAAGAAYVLAPFTLTNLYVRQALADYAAMAFIPWALWGMYGWAAPAPRARARHLATAAAATALVALSSNPVTLVAVPALMLYVVFLAWRARSWRPLVRGAWGLGLGLGLAAFFWVPALAERHWVKTHQLLSGYLNYRNHFVYLHQLAHSPWGYGLSLPGPEDGMSFALGPVQLAMVVTALVLARHFRDRPAGEWRAQLWFFLSLVGLVAFLVTDNSVWLWDALPLLQYLEFPWRILVLGTVACAFLCGAPFVALHDPRHRHWLLAAVLGGLLLAGLPHARPERFLDVNEADYSAAAIAKRGVEVTTTGEYEPVWVVARPAKPAPASRLSLLAGQVRVLESHTSGSAFRWRIQANGTAQLRVSAFYYPGWRLTVDGQLRPLSVQKPNGLIDFTLESGVHEVALTFGPTPLRSRALAVSAAALALLTLSLGVLGVPVVTLKTSLPRARRAASAVSACHKYERNGIDEDKHSDSQLCHHPGDDPAGRRPEPGREQRGRANASDGDGGAREV